MDPSTVEGGFYEMPATQRSYRIRIEEPVLRQRKPLCCCSSLERASKGSVIADIVISFLMYTFPILDLIIHPRVGIIVVAASLFIVCLTGSLVVGFLYVFAIPVTCSPHHRALNWTYYTIFKLIFLTGLWFATAIGGAFYGNQKIMDRVYVYALAALAGMLLVLLCIYSWLIWIVFAQVTDLRKNYDPTSTTTANMNIILEDGDLPRPSKNQLSPHAEPTELEEI